MEEWMNEWMDERMNEWSQIDMGSLHDDFVSLRHCNRFSKKYPKKEDDYSYREISV